jgi:VanZ family protein
MQKDKILHGIISALISGIALYFLKNIVVAFGIGLAIGLIKEVIWDYLMKKGQFDVNDILADVIGCFLGIAIIELLV